MQKKGDKEKFTFGRHKVGKYDFSYSGIKTSILRVVEKEVDKNPNFIKRKPRRFMCKYTTYHC